MNWIDIVIAAISGGGLTGIATWFVSKRKRNNDFLSDLQGSINSLSDNYTQTLNELVQVKMQNSKLLIQVSIMEDQVKQLTEANTRLIVQVGKLQNEVGQLKDENATLIRKLNELKRILKTKDEGSN